MIMSYGSGWGVEPLPACNWAKSQLECMDVHKKSIGLRNKKDVSKVVNNQEQLFRCESLSKKKQKKVYYYYYHFVNMHTIYIPYKHNK